MARPGLLLRTERIDYCEAWDAQRALARGRATGALPDVVWLLEHPPVYTTGRHGRREDLFLSDEALAAAGAEFVAADRGGQMTWHGPGQTVGYAICDLRPGGRVRAFVETLVGAMADAAALPDAQPRTDAVGLYAGGRKLGSVGIRVSGGITAHGIALNRDPDLEPFRLMTACGAPEVEATSIAAEGGDPRRERVDGALAEALGERLGLRLEPAALGDVLPLLDLDVEVGAMRRRLEHRWRERLGKPSVDSQGTKTPPATIEGQWVLRDERMGERYPWPEGMEYYDDPFWIYEAPDGRLFGLGRVSAGREDRPFWMTFVLGAEGGSKRAVVLFMATNDYADTGEAAALIRGKGPTGRAMYGMDEALPAAYAEMRIERYKDRVTGERYSYDKAAVIAHGDDHVAMLRHAMAQVDLRGLEPQAA
ncbi:MAG TPA: lipoyl(octanoyl) transferase LipB [Miltoncostaeaceae bacterium]|nr:lipoyl(octanoyl) transferase LipB [Miltoncostaeaceae bacterium]